MMKNTTKYIVMSEAECSFYQHDLRGTYDTKAEALEAAKEIKKRLNKTKLFKGERVYVVKRVTTHVADV